MYTLYFTKQSYTSINRMYTCMHRLESTHTHMYILKRTGIHFLPRILNAIFGNGLDPVLKADEYIQKTNTLVD